jgi:dienelactone hydrolase
MKGLSLKECISTVEAGIDYMRKKLNLKVIILMGISMGGALAWRILESIEVHGAIIFYGIPDLAHLKVGKIKVPVLAFFGKEDKIKGFSDPETVAKLADSIKKNKLSNIEIVELEDAGHGFAGYNTNYYNEEAVEECAAKIDPFIKEV